MVVTVRTTTNSVPAAFGRLCVETRKLAAARLHSHQPPSGGCVLKPVNGGDNEEIAKTQPPSGGCVLKLFHTIPI